MKVVTAEQMQEIDRITISENGFPGEALMGIAGKSVYDLILSKYKNIIKAAVFSGTGNNGGDGFVIAYYLSNSGVDVQIYITGDVEKISSTSAPYFILCKNIGLQINIFQENNDYIEQFADCNIIIDAIAGTGFKGKAGGTVSYAIKLINSLNITTISVDIPSGLPANGAGPVGDAVMADATITIGLPKISLVTYPGKKFTGDLFTVDIGFPSSLTESEEIKVELIDREFVYARLKAENNEDINKSDNGHLLLIGGFDGMEGAIMMTAGAALETGVGLLSLITTEISRNIIAGKIPELITKSFDAGNINLLKIIENNLKERRYDAAIIGPGMGRDDLSGKIFQYIIENISNSGVKKILIDGDGLYHLAEYKKRKKINSNIEIILTPHFLEVSRLNKKDIKTVLDNRFETAKELADEYNSVVLMKGPLSIISDGAESLINTTGSRAMATAGSGDVLAGITGSLMLKNLTSLEAAGLGAYIHGKSADIYCRENNTDVMKATDIIINIRKVLKVEI